MAASFFPLIISLFIRISFQECFFILIVEKKKNSDGLLLGGYANEI
jgi:hypothetical protein